MGTGGRGATANFCDAGAPDSPVRAPPRFAGVSAPRNRYARGVATDFDIAVVGAGFAGSLLAMVARRLGRRVLLVERGRHPRFAIGESSTPVANLLLEELARDHGLPRLLPLAKWGSWQREHPGIACGLKRGFTFLAHRTGEPWAPDPAHTRELLVAASPRDEVADTHWYRPDFDAFLASEAVRLGAEHLDSTELDAPEFTPAGVTLSGRRGNAAVRATAGFLVDASGPRGYLHRTLGLGEADVGESLNTWSVFSHFTGVRRWDALHPSDPTPPYPPDDAALHHVTEDGWMWVLRFNNGITSAGFTSRAASDGGRPAADLWREWMARFPSVAEQFAGAVPVREFTRMAPMAFRTRRAAGPRWLQLPMAAGFVDPLLSTGFPLTLLGVERVARLVEEGLPAEGVEAYAARTLGDLDHARSLVEALYRVMGDFPSFRELTMAYFTAAIYSETARRLGRPEAAPGFLMREHPVFGPATRDLLAMAGRVPGPVLRDAVRRLVEPFNLGGLCDDSKRNWYGCDAADLYAAAGKIQSTPEALRAMLQRCGFA